MPSFIEADHRTFAKGARHPHDANSALRPEEDLDLILTWRELRKVSHNLLPQYERKLYVLVDTAESQRLIGKYVEVFEHPDGRIGIRVGARALPYSLYRREIRWPVGPSTAHRAGGSRMPRSRRVDSQKPRGRASPPRLHPRE